MSKETRLPKGIRMKNGSYEARATIKGVPYTPFDRLVE